MLIRLSLSLGCAILVLQNGFYVWREVFMTAISVRLPNEIELRLKNLAKLTGRSKTFYITAAILEKLDDLEDIYLAEKRLEDIQIGKTKTIPLEDVMKRYGMEN